MSGVAVIRHLLANHAPLLALVPASRIIAGPLKSNTELPAIAVTEVYSDPQNGIRINEAGKPHTESVQVTWQVKDPDATPGGTGYVGMKQLAPIILAACPSQRGTVNGVAVDSIAPGLDGPDIYFPDVGIHSKTRDFTVRWVGA